MQGTFLKIKEVGGTHVDFLRFGRDEELQTFAAEVEIVTRDSGTGDRGDHDSPGEPHQQQIANKREN